MNLVELTYQDANRIIKESINIDSKNVLASARMGKDTISVFNSAILKTDEEPIYALVPYKTEKQTNGKWLHNMSNYKIYKITREYLVKQSIDFNFLPTDRTRLLLSEDICIYNTEEINRKEEDDTIIINRELSLKENVCIMLKVPESGTEWIDALIRKSNLIGLNRN